MGNRPNAHPVTGFPRLLRPREVSRMLSVDRNTVYHLVHEGLLPAVRIGKTLRIPEPAVRRLVKDGLRAWKERLRGGARRAGA